jgi:hypothetical protein
MIYIASPYTHDDPAVRQERYEAVRDYIAKQTSLTGHFYFSPIVHYHDMAVKNDMPTDAKTWWRINEDALSRCDALWILKIDGYQESKGVAMEFEYCSNWGIEVVYVDPIEI